MSASKPNVRLFPYFFTNHAFGIVALICNLNLNGLSPTLHQAYLTRLKQCCSCGWIHLFVGLPHPVVDTSVNLIYFFMWMWIFCNFFLFVVIFRQLKCVTYLGKLSYKNSHPSVTTVQQLLPAFQLCQTPKKKREGDVDKKVEVHAPVSPFP